MDLGVTVVEAFSIFMLKIAVVIFPMGGMLFLTAPRDKSDPWQGLFCLLLAVAIQFFIL